MDCLLMNVAIENRLLWGSGGILTNSPTRTGVAEFVRIPPGRAKPTNDD